LANPGQRAASHRCDHVISSELLQQRFVLLNATVALLCSNTCHSNGTALHNRPLTGESCSNDSTTLWCLKPNTVGVVASPSGSLVLMARKGYRRKSAHCQKPPPTPLHTLRFLGATRDGRLPTGASSPLQLRRSPSRQGQRDDANRNN